MDQPDCEPVRYKETLFGCYDDMNTCCYGTWCPFCLNARNFAHIREEEVQSCHIFCVANPFWVRQLYKKQRHMKINYFIDCMAVSFCTPCAICQDAREIQG